jgi:hypothetical protein
LDEDEIQKGADFEEEILAALEEANELLVLFTPWAVDRPYVWAEIGAAWGRRIPIVTLLYGISGEELQANTGIPVFLKKRNLLDLNAIDTYLGELRERISRESPGSGGHHV